MLDLTWNHSTIEEVLGLGASVLTMLMMLGVATWLAHSIVRSVSKMHRSVVPRSSYDALLRENERLRGLLLDAREKNDYLRKLYSTPSSHVTVDRRRNAA